MSLPLRDDEQWADWKIGPDELILESRGHYDAQEWDRQAKGR